MEEFKIEWNETPPHVLVVWDNASNVATWCDREDIEKHWGRNPHRCECVGYLIGEDKDGYYVAARAGMFNEEEDAWGLIERIPKGCVREIIPLYKQDNMTIRRFNRKIIRSGVVWNKGLYRSIEGRRIIMEGRIRVYPNVNKIYAQDAFKAMIGKRVPLRNQDVVVGSATIISAKVSPDGLYAELTLQTDLDLGSDNLIERSLSYGTDGSPDEGTPPTG